MPAGEDREVMEDQTEMMMPFGLPKDGKTQMLMDKDTAEQLSAPVERYRQCPDASPWHLSTVVVIGLVCCDGQGSLVDCFEHIIAMFPCWRRAASAALFGCHDIGRRELLRPFEEALLNYNIPISMTENPSFGRHNFETIIFSITREAAIEHLRKTIVPPKHPVRSLPQRLLDLPAELRNRIYEDVFVFPSTGIRITHLTNGAEEAIVTTRTRSLESAPFDKGVMRKWVMESNMTGPPSKESHLSIGTLASLVSPSWLGKQIWQEAMPIFYDPTLQKAFPLHLGHLRSSASRIRKQGLELLRLAPALEHITIAIYVPHGSWKGFDSVESYKGFPGLWATLVKLNSLKSFKIYTLSNEMSRQTNLYLKSGVIQHRELEHVEFSIDDKPLEQCSID